MWFLIARVVSIRNVRWVESKDKGDVKGGRERRLEDDAIRATER
jgi:hypothetical protein